MPFRWKTFIYVTCLVFIGVSSSEAAPARHKNDAHVASPAILR